MSRVKGSIPWNKGKTGLWGKPKSLRDCKVCGKQFRIYPSTTQRFCSSRCYGDSLVGTKVHRVFSKNHGKWNLGKKFPERTGEKNYAWKGDKAKYIAKHAWIYRQKGRPVKCEHCGETKKKLHWANIDHRYTRNLEDYISLCVSCHRKYDYRILGIKTKSGKCRLIIRTP